VRDDLSSIIIKDDINSKTTTKTKTGVTPPSSPVTAIA